MWTIELLIWAWHVAQDIVPYLQSTSSTRLRRRRRRRSIPDDRWQRGGDLRGYKRSLVGSSQTYSTPTPIISSRHCSHWIFMFMATLIMPPKHSRNYTVLDMGTTMANKLFIIYWPIRKCLILPASLRLRGPHNRRSGDLLPLLIPSNNALAGIRSIWDRCSGLWCSMRHHTLI